jgi:hypothetical protein
MAPPVPICPTVNCLPDLPDPNKSGDAFMAASLARTAADALTGISFFLALFAIVTAGGLGSPPSSVAFPGLSSDCTGLRFSSIELRDLVVAGLAEEVRFLSMSWLTAPGDFTAVMVVPAVLTCRLDRHEPGRGVPVPGVGSSKFVDAAVC